MADTRLEALELYNKESKNLIDAMLEARQVAAKIQAQNETSRTEYMVELNKRVDIQDKRIANLEARAH